MVLHCNGFDLYEPDTKLTRTEGAAPARANTL